MASEKHLIQWIELTIFSKILEQPQIHNKQIFCKNNLWWTNIIVIILLCTNLYPYSTTHHPPHPVPTMDF